MDRPVKPLEVLAGLMVRHFGRSTHSRTSWLKPLTYIWLAAAIVLGILIGETAASPKFAVQPKQILFLHSFGPNFQLGTTWSREIQSELNRQSPLALDIQEYSLVTARNGDNAAQTKFVEYLNSLYAERWPDLIVAVGAPAARFLQQHRAKLFPATPMLVATLDMRRVEPSILSANDAVVAVQFNQVAFIQDILRLLPETKLIALIIGNSPFERYLAEEQRRLLGPLLENKVELIFYNESPFAEILKDVANLPPNSAILFLALSVDGAGAIYRDKQPLKRIYEVANAPIFSYDETYLTGETVGGPMFSPIGGARPVAEAAVRLLGGGKGSDIKVSSIGFSAPKYDWRLLQRWNISESRLPPGSEILFREPTLWQRYWWQLALMIAVFLAQAGLIWALLFEHRRRQLAEVQSRERLTELARVVRFSTAGELTASIAHEINQPLGAILTNAETAHAILKSPNPDIAELNEIVGDIVRDNQRASEVIRRMRNLLRKTPYELRSLDLNALVRETVELLTKLAIARNVELVSVTKSDALPILGDPIQLQQVILSFVVNGIEAMPPKIAELLSGLRASKSLRSYPSPTVAAASCPNTS